MNAEPKPCACDVDDYDYSRIDNPSCERHHPRVEADATPPAVAQGLVFLLTRIGSWTNARWDQHLRERLGDEHAETVIRWLAEHDIRPHIPEGTSGRALQESIR